MLRITADPTADADRWDKEQSEWLNNLPVCVNCTQPIQDDYFFYINGNAYCEECVKELFQRRVEA